jgi:hypothetical protein
LKTIHTIKKYIPNVEILFCECSDLSTHEAVEIENDIKINVNYYYNFYNDENIKESVNSMFK